MSVEQFTKINKAKEDVKRIKKGVTAEAEIRQWFGKPAGEMYVEDPVTQKDREEFTKFLHEHMPNDLNTQYSLPTSNQKLLYYIFPWTFEHSVPCESKMGDCSTNENLVILVTIGKKTGLVEEFASFDFHFEKEFKQ